MTVQVFLAVFEDDAVGYDLEVTGKNATVQDYLNALNRFQEEHVASCRGCDGCCWERIPLTSIDVQNYLADPEIKASLAPDGLLIKSFVEQYCHIFCQGPAVDISLGRRADGACIFLNTAEKTCARHPLRSLVCQTFICLPHSERAGRFRDILLNTGEDELVREYLIQVKQAGQKLKINAGKNPTPSLEDYPPTPFSGKTTYHQVKIKSIVPAQLWKELYTC